MHIVHSLHFLALHFAYCFPTSLYALLVFNFSMGIRYFPYPVDLPYVSLQADLVPSQRYLMVIFMGGGELQVKVGPIVRKSEVFPLGK